MQDKIKQELKNAMLSRDVVKTQTLRLLLTAFTNEMVSEARIASGKTSSDPLTDEECIKVIKKLVKQRKDSIEQFIAGGREDLAEAEKQELAILEALLPAQMSKEEIETFVKNKLQSQEVKPEEKGKFIGSIMKEIGQNADGALVKEVVDNILK